MRTLLAGVAAAATALASGLVAGLPATASSTSASTSQVSSSSQAGTNYVVLYQEGGNVSAVTAAVAKAGGSVVSENTDLGYVVAHSASSRFAATVSASPSVVGAARDRVVGVAPKETRAASSDVERLPAERNAARQHGGASAQTAHHAAAAAEPLANRQWDMRQIGATPTGSYAKQTGKRSVLVGVIDTGIDGTHPDIAPNFDAALSRNFVTDIPSIDGPCEHPSCVDPANEDDNEHGTHVASTIASPINGLGIAGVAPNVKLVNIRAGQDSGYFFLLPTLRALTYAGRIGVDVVNMSYYTDPWLYNCTNNPADSPAEQLEQRVVREATQRALTFARNHGVLPIAAEGNEATDLGHPTIDTTSPDFPVGAAKTRHIDNSCISVPTESKGVVAVSSTGITTRKAYYSNYGTEQTDVAAPGGDFYDSPDNTGDVRNLVLAAFPKSLAELNGDLNPDGTPNTDFVVRDCKGTTCGYYQYLQGTSMAAPHAVGVAALIVSQYGRQDRHHPGLTLSASATESRLLGSAVEHACPQPRLFHYTRILGDGSVSESDAYCAGGINKNGFYGSGIVNAYAAVTGHR